MRPSRSGRVGSLSFRALRAIAAGLARVEQPLPADTAGDGPAFVTADRHRLLRRVADHLARRLGPRAARPRRRPQRAPDRRWRAHRDLLGPPDRAAESAVRTLRRGSVTLAEPHGGARPGQPVGRRRHLTARLLAAPGRRHLLRPPPRRGLPSAALDARGGPAGPCHVGRMRSSPAPLRSGWWTMTTTGRRPTRFRPHFEGQSDNALSMMLPRCEPPPFPSARSAAHRSRFRPHLRSAGVLRQALGLRQAGGAVDPVRKDGVPGVAHAAEVLAGAVGGPGRLTTSSRRAATTGPRANSNSVSIWAIASANRRWWPMRRTPSLGGVTWVPCLVPAGIGACPPYRRAPPPDHQAFSSPGHRSMTLP